MQNVLFTDFHNIANNPPKIIFEDEVLNEIWVYFFSLVLSKNYINNKPMTWAKSNKYRLYFGKKNDEQLYILILNIEIISYLYLQYFDLDEKYKK